MNDIYQPLHVKLKLSSFVVWAAHHSDTDDRKLLFDSVSNYGGCSFWVSAPRTMWSVFVKNQELVGVYTDRFQAISQNVIIENPYLMPLSIIAINRVIDHLINYWLGAHGPWILSEIWISVGPPLGGATKLRAQRGNPLKASPNWQKTICQGTLRSPPRIIPARP